MRATARKVPSTYLPSVPTISITGDPESDGLLSEDPLALVVGMLLDQQIPMEKAFSGPRVLKERLGRLDAATLASRDDLADVMATPPAVHRFPGSMAGRVQALAQHLLDAHGGRAEALWEGVASGQDLYQRIVALPGFGEQKARILVALLGKQYGVRPKGWREAAGSYGDDGARRSVADVVDKESLLQVRAFKKEQKAAARASRSA